MRSIVWFLLVAVIAVVGATALGANDGLVTIYWRGWRTDFSLNLFLLGLLGFLFRFGLLGKAAILQGKIGICNVGDDDTNCGRFLTSQASGNCIWTVIQTINDLKHFFSGVFFNIFISIHHFI